MRVSEEKGISSSKVANLMNLLIAPAPTKARSMHAVLPTPTILVNAKSTRVHQLLMTMKVKMILVGALIGTNPGADTTQAVQGTSAKNGGTGGTISPAANTAVPLPEGRADVNMPAENDGTIQRGTSTSANPAAGATTPATAPMANVSTLTRNSGTIYGTNAHPGGSTTAQTANSMDAWGSFDADLFDDLEQHIFEFDGAVISPL